MKLREFKQLKEQSNAELQAKLNDLRKELFNLRFQLVTRQLTNPARIRQVRKGIARILTLLRERELRQ